MKDLSTGIKDMRKGKPAWASKPLAGHLFDRTLPFMATLQGLALIDTGSPESFGGMQEFALGSNRHRLQRSPLLDEIRRHLGSDIDAAIGMDILSRYDLRVEYMPSIGEYHVQASRAVNLRREQCAPVRSELGIPIVDAVVNGEVVPMFIDTGSHHTYIDKALARGAQVDTIHDFFPGLGTFAAETYYATLSLCGCDFDTKVAVLPGTLQYLLHVSGVKGIIGMDLLKRQTTWLGFLSGVIAFDVDKIPRQPSQ
jgi:hypothetical protein